MKKIIITVFIALVFIGCATENQQKALDEIAKNYQAKTGFVKGFSNNIGESSRVFFKINVSESDIIQTLNPEHAASNIALIAVKNIPQDELKKYTHIEVEIKQKQSGDIITRIFEIGEIMAPSVQSQIAEKFSNYLIQSEYKLLTDMIDPQYKKPEDQENIKNYIDQFIQENGAIESFYSTEFKYTIYEDNFKVNTFKGRFVFANGKTLGYQVQTYEDTANSYIYSFNID